LLNVFYNIYDYYYSPVLVAWIDLLGPNHCEVLCRHGVIDRAHARSE